MERGVRKGGEGARSGDRRGGADRWGQRARPLSSFHVRLAPELPVKLKEPVLRTDSGTSLIACCGDCDCYYMDMVLYGLQVAILGTL